MPGHVSLCGNDLAKAFAEADVRMILPQSVPPNAYPSSSAEDAVSNLVFPPSSPCCVFSEFLYFIVLPCHVYVAMNRAPFIFLQKNFEMRRFVHQLWFCFTGNLLF